MARELMDAEQIRRATVALGFLCEAKLLVGEAFKLLDGTNVEMPTGATINSAMEWAEKHLGDAIERLVAGADVREAKITHGTHQNILPALRDALVSKDGAEWCENVNGADFIELVSDLLDYAGLGPSGLVRPEDLCDVCKVEGHDQCRGDSGCACCRNTMQEGM